MSMPWLLVKLEVISVHVRVCFHVHAGEEFLCPHQFPSLCPCPENLLVFVRQVHGSQDDPCKKNVQHPISL
jgi:hypothetical protein